MKKFKKGDYIDCYTLKDYEVIKFEDHFLMVKKNENNSCKNCFFNTNEHSTIINKEININFEFPLKLAFIPQRSFSNS